MMSDDMRSSGNPIVGIGTSQPILNHSGLSSSSKLAKRPGEVNSGAPSKSSGPFAAALRSLAKQAGPDVKEGEKEPTKEKPATPSAPTAPPTLKHHHTTAGFQPYRPDDRLTHPAASPFGFVDPSPYSPYSPHPSLYSSAALQLRLEEQLYLERAFRSGALAGYGGVPGVPISHYAALYPPPIHPHHPHHIQLAVHERLKLEEEHRARRAREEEREKEVALQRERERERELREREKELALQREREREREREQRERELKERERLAREKEHRARERESLRDERERERMIAAHMSHLLPPALFGPPSLAARHLLGSLPLMPVPRSPYPPQRYMPPVSSAPTVAEPWRTATPPAAPTPPEVVPPSAPQPAPSVPPPASSGEPPASQPAAEPEPV